MKIKFLGSGSGLCSPKENYHSNILITADSQKNLLFDCGSHFQMAIEEAKISEKSIDAVYISHLHADHVGGLEWLAFKRYFGSFPFGKDKPYLFGNTKIIKDLWRNTLSGGMESIQGKRNTLNEYFIAFPVKANGCFAFGDSSFNLVQTVHVVDDRRIKPSYGLMIHQAGTKIFITGDTQFAPSALLTYYDQADVIFHDCELAEYPGSVHTQARELVTLPEKIRKKMWMYHYSGDFSKYGDKFAGFVTKGDEFNFKCEGEK